MGRAKAGSTGEPSDRPDPWGVALKQLALRARTAEEVRRSLARRGYKGDEIAAVLARLTARPAEAAVAHRSVKVA